MGHDKEAFAAEVAAALGELYSASRMPVLVLRRSGEIVAANATAIAKYGYRPVNPAILKKHSSQFPKIDLFPVTILAKDWDDAQQKFFADNGVFDVIYKPKAQ